MGVQRGTQGRAGAPDAPEKAPILEVRNLGYSYDGTRDVLADVSFSLEAGSVLVILGANGTGKSTMLNCVANMLTPTCGEVLVAGKPVRSYSDGELARVLGYVPQLATPTFSYTVRDYVVMGRAPRMGLLSVPGKDEYAKADEALERMGISHLADKLCTNVSGGERQQAQIARVLVQETPLVLLDEPTNHLDYGNQLRIVKIVAALAREGLTVVMTSHVPDHAILLDGQVGLLDRRGSMRVGAAREVVTEESLRELYDIDLHLVHIEQLGRTACVAGAL